MDDQDLDPDVLKLIQTQGGYSVPTVDRTGDLFNSIGGGLRKGWNFLNTPISGDAAAPQASSPMGAVTGGSLSPDFAQAPGTGLQAGVTASQLPAQSAPPWQTKPIMKLASLNPVSGGADPSVQQAIGKKYGFGEGLDSDAIKAAQERARGDTLNANLGEAGNDIANAFAAGRGSNKVLDNKFYENMKTQAQQPIQNIAALRQAKLQDIGAASTMAENDPNSEISQNMRKVFSQMGIPAEALGGVSAADLKQYQNPMELIAKMKSQREMKELALAQIKANKELTLSNKQTDKIASAYKDTMNDEIVKGAKGELSQANTVLSLADDATVNPESANALKIYAARYSVGGKRINETEIKNMGAGSKDILAKLDQTVSTAKGGVLTPENAKFMKRFVHTTQKTASQNYQDAVKDRADAYSKIYDVDKNELYDKFGVNTRVTGSENSGSHPQDAQALEWAHANPNDPRAAKILSLQGG